MKKIGVLLLAICLLLCGCGNKTQEKLNILQCMKKDDTKNLEL